MSGQYKGDFLYQGTLSCCESPSYALLWPKIIRIWSRKELKDHLVVNTHNVLLYGSYRMSIFPGVIESV